MIAQELERKAEDLYWQPDKITIALRQLWVQLALAQVAQTRSRVQVLLKIQNCS